MLNLGKNNRVDWFRVVIDLERNGINVPAISAMSDIPRSTINGWKNYQSRPRLEEGTLVLNIWVKYTGSDISKIPTYDPYNPHKIN